MAKEVRLQERCVAFLKKLEPHGVTYFVTTGSVYLTGEPDIIINYKGLFVGCELKNGKEGQLRPVQKIKLEKYQLTGAIVRRVDTYGQFLDLIDAAEQRYQQIIQNIAVRA